METTSNHKLVIFYGSGPGAGKSTLSSFLYEQLGLHDTPVRWIYEDDILDLEAFQTFVKDIQRGNRELIHSLLEASKEFVKQREKRDEIIITDSIFPCFNWLIATGFYSQERMKDFGIALEQILQPLNPLVIYLDSDQQTSLSRAVKQRGQKWLDDLLAAMNNYNINRDKPLQNLDDAVSYFKMVGDLSLKWLKEWESEMLVLDTTDKDVLELKRTLLKALGIHAIASPTRMDASFLLLFTGAYKCENDTTTANERLTVELTDGILKVNLYWPNGCELLADEGDMFRLKDTNHRVRFDDFKNGIPHAAIYHSRGQTYRYIRVAS